MSLRSSKVSCCVVGCHNRYSNTSENVVFYSFPNKSWPQRRDLWIRAINRKDSQGKLWQPTAYSRVCSVHFVGGRKSNHPNHPAFGPTIMPPAYKKGEQNIKNCTARFKRFIERNQIESGVCDPTSYADEWDSPSAILIPEVNLVEKDDFSCQTDFIVSEKSCEISVLNCCILPNQEASTQCNINICATRSNADSVYTKYTAKKHSGCGPDEKTVFFYGYSSIKNDEQMSSLCGVSVITFSFLLNFLGVATIKMSNENKLLLFLMKIKSSLSFLALGVLFGISRQSASRKFFSVLEKLTEKCSGLVYWPSREAVKKTLPSVFVNYPNVRAVIDCTEFKCEKPPRTDEQVYLYSNYKGNYTLKYLIAITPSGFISKGYGGRSTDAFVLTNCGLLNLLEERDVIMADKGFPLIKNNLIKQQIEIIMPPFANAPQFTLEETNETYEIAKVRIHVERCIARLKTYKILDKFTTDLLPYADTIIRICCCLVNLQPPILKVE